MILYIALAALVIIPLVGLIISNNHQDEDREGSIYKSMFKGDYWKYW